MFDRSTYEYFGRQYNNFIGSLGPGKQVMGGRCFKRRRVNKNIGKFFAFDLCRKQGGSIQHIAGSKDFLFDYHHPHADVLGIYIF